MRQTHTFILTLVSDDDQPGLWRGRVRRVATGDEAAFVGIKELVRLVRAQTLLSDHPHSEDDDSAMPISTGNAEPGSTMPTP